MADGTTRWHNCELGRPRRNSELSVSFLAALRVVLTRSVVSRLVLGWGTFLVVLVARPVLAGELPLAVLVGVLLAIVAVIIVCSFEVVAEAEYLAHRLKDPYGTLVLTLSIVMIEAILISAVMLGPGDHPTIGRDSVMAVSMIILNLVVGVALIVAAWRGEARPVNPTGVAGYLSLLLVLVMVAFALPAVIGTDGSYSVTQAVPIAVLTVVLYVFFLFRQTGVERADYQEVLSDDAPPVTDALEPQRTSVVRVIAEHRNEILLRVIVLVLTVTPIVLLSQDMAALLDEGLGRAGAPVALSGLLIAMIVFLPETITTVRAAREGEMQRVSNLCHGALVSTVGLTIPAVLIIGLLTGQRVVLGESPVNLLLLGVTLALTLASFSGRRVSATHGAAHLVMFVLFGLTLFSG